MSRLEENYNDYIVSTNFSQLVFLVISYCCPDGNLSAVRVRTPLFLNSRCVSTYPETKKEKKEQPRSDRSSHVILRGYDGMRSTLCTASRSCEASPMLNTFCREGRVFAKNSLIFSANICSFHCEGFWKPSGSKVDRALTDSTSVMKPR